MNRLSLNPSKFGLFLFLLSGILMIPVSSQALPEDREQPINLEADSASFDQNTGISIYEGNVVVTQGSMYLAADKATVYIEGGEFQRMEAVGSPSRFRYKPTHDKPQIDGVGNRVQYNAVTAKVIVSGSAKFTQGGDSFTGQRIEYDLTSDVVKADGGEQGRIQFIIQPKSLKDQ
jgi:lipopolysaccharide export system protein LptA